MMKKHTYASASSTINIFFYKPAERWAIQTPPRGRGARNRIPEERFKEYLSQLKRGCNAFYREAAKAWLVPDESLEDAIKICGHFFPFCSIDRKKKVEYTARPPMADSPPIDIWATFTDLAGWQRNGHTPTIEELKPIYRRAVRRHHPDLGGDTDKMALLNIAWKAIEEELSHAS